MSGVFVEDPFMRIVDVHWKKKKPGPPDQPPPPYVGYYGWGCQVTGGGEIGAGGNVGYGPHQYAPFVGTWFTDGTMNYDGMFEMGNILPHPLGGYPREQPTKTTHGSDDTMEFDLTQSVLQTTSRTLAFMMSEDGIHMGFGWQVPMVYGEVLVNWGTAEDPFYFTLPCVVKRYTVTYEWASSRTDGASLGIGFVHPMKNDPRDDPRPPEPYYIAGPISGGSYTFTYDVKYFESVFTEVTPANQYDPSIGGTVMIRLFGGSPLHGPGDYFTWEVIPEPDMSPAKPVFGSTMMTPNALLRRIAR